MCSLVHVLLGYELIHVVYISGSLVIIRDIFQPLSRPISKFFNVIIYLKKTIVILPTYTVP